MHNLAIKDFNTLSDKELIYLIIQNNQKAIEFFFYEKCSTLLYYITSQIFVHRIDRDEMVNELYLYLCKDNWKILRDFEGRSKLTTWMSVVAVRFFIKRKQHIIKDNGKDTLNHDAEINSLHASNSRITEKMDVLNAIQKLSSPRDKFVVISMEIEGFEADEVARQLNVTKANLYNIKKRALEKLSKILNEYDYVDR